MSTPEQIEAALVKAIEEREIVRLGYDRVQRGAILTLHYIAPIDIRPGDTEATKSIRYLFAYCFDQARLETHLLTRCRTVTATGERFQGDTVLGKWPLRWPKPDRWVIPRDW